MSLAFVLPLATAILLALSQLMSWLDIRLRKRNARLKHGCRETFVYPHKDRIWGSDLAKIRSQALKNGNFNKLYLKHHRQYGKVWQEVSDGSTVLNTISTANARFIFATGETDFDRPVKRARATYQLFGDGIIVSKGAQWKKSRDLIKPTFSRYEVGNMPMVETHVDRFMDAIPRDGRSFDAQPLLKKLVLDIATEFLFGESFDAQLPEKAAESEDFLKLLDSALLGLNKRRQPTSLSSLRLFFDKSYDADVAKVHAFIDERVKAALERNLENGEKTEPRGGRYILLDELSKEIRDPVRLRSEILQVFTPGRDNIAILLSNALFQLARHPKYWTQLRECVLALGPDPDFSFEMLKSLVPFRHVLHESLRTLGPGGRTTRFAAVDTILPEGGGPEGKDPVFVLKDTKIVIHTPVMHRDKGYWGEDADEFKPERWQTKKPQWEFIPFIGGPKICPAQNQVLVQATYVLARLVKEFEAIENRDDVLEFVEIQRLTTESRRGAIIGLLQGKGS